MKIHKHILALAAMAALPTLSFAQTAQDSTSSPTSSADGGAQHTSMQGDPSKHGPTEGTTTDAPKFSPTNTNTGGSVDTGTPKDNADKNSNVEKQGTTDTSTTNGQ